METYSSNYKWNGRLGSSVFVCLTPVSVLMLSFCVILKNSFLCRQSDYKKLLRSPPRIKVPTARDVIRQHPCLGILPYEVRQALENSVKEILKPQGMVLSEKGCLPRSLFLIANGLVKVSICQLKQGLFETVHYVLD